MKCKLFLSSAQIGDEYSGGVSSNENVIGRADYTYKFVKDNFMQVFAKARIDFEEITTPEIYQDITKYIQSERAIHIRFASPHNIRILRGAYNIAVFFWEFQKLDESKNSLIPTDNYLHMLSLVDEIWVGCTFTKNVLNSYGFENVFVIPSPLSQSLKPCDSRKGITSDKPLSNIKGFSLDFKFENQFDKVVNETSLHELLDKTSSSYFLTVMNVHDFRKDLKTLIFAYHSLTAEHKKKYPLIIKTFFPEIKLRNDGTDRLFGRELIGLLHDRLFPIKVIKDVNIIFIKQFLSESELKNLYSKAFYYVSSSAAEGQNLPLLEAMANDIPVISSNKSAMSDYVTDKVGLVLKTNLKRAHVDGTSMKRRDVFWNKVDQSDLTQKFNLAIEKGDTLRSNLSVAAKSAVENFCGDDLIVSLVRDRFKEITEKKLFS